MRATCCAPATSATSPPSAPPGRYRSLGRIILLHRGLHGQPRIAVNYWARSSGNRYVMLGARYRSIGVGKASRSFQGHKFTLWVSHVGRR